MTKSQHANGTGKTRSTTRHRLPALILLLCSLAVAAGGVLPTTMTTMVWAFSPNAADAVTILSLHRNSITLHPIRPRTPWAHASTSAVASAAAAVQGGSDESSTPTPPSSKITWPWMDATTGKIIDASTVPEQLKGTRVALYFASPDCPLCHELEFMLPQYRQALKDSKQPISLVYVPCFASNDPTTTANTNTEQRMLDHMAALGLSLGVPVGAAADALKREYKIWATAEHDRLTNGGGDGGSSSNSDDAAAASSTSTGVSSPKVQYAVRPDIMDVDASGDADATTTSTVANTESGGDNNVDTGMKNGEAVEAAVANAITTTPSPTTRTDIIVKRSDLISSLEGRRSGVPALVVLDTDGKELVFLNAERDGITAMADWPLDDLRGIW